MRLLTGYDHVITVDPAEAAVMIAHKTLPLRTKNPLARKGQQGREL
jgi:hypothetical protein